MSIVAVIAAGRLGWDEPGGLNAVLQPFDDGDYDGGHLRVYSGEFPHPLTDPLLIDATLPTPAMASIVNENEIILSTLAGQEVLLASPANALKYAIVSKPDESDPIVLSVGLSGDDTPPDLVVSTVNWYPTETVDFDDSHVFAILDVLTQFVGEVSNDTPEQDDSYTTIFEAQDADDNPVKRIGISLTVTVVGDDPGTALESEIVSNREGVFETVHNTAGGAGDIENTRVTNGAIVSDGPDVTPIASNRELTLTTLTYEGATSGTLESEVVVIPAGAAMLVYALSIANNVPTLADEDGVPLDPQPFSFTEDANVHGGSGGYLRLYNSGALALEFTGKLLLDTSGSATTYLIHKAVPNLPAATIAAVVANTVTMHDESGATSIATVTYPQETFANSHNLGVALFGSYGPVESGVSSFWTEATEVNPGGGNPLGFAAQYRLGPSTFAQAIYGSNPLLLWGLAVEYEAVP